MLAMRALLVVALVAVFMTHAAVAAPSTAPSAMCSGSAWDKLLSNLNANCKVFDYTMRYTKIYNYTKGLETACGTTCGKYCSVMYSKYGSCVHYEGNYYYAGKVCAINNNI